MERGGRAAPPCRNFARGSCRWGQRCRFAHAGRAARTCRYFQSGLCSYGDRCCYRHVWEEPGGSPGAAEPPWPPPPAAPQPDREDKGGPGAVAGAPVPAQGASGSREPGWRPAPSGCGQADAVTRGWRTDTGAAGCPERGRAACDPRQPRSRAGAAERRAQSAAVACGICMERVYEKALPEERLFGILPNCGHAFCLACIRQWRRSRDFEASVIKACPECRVTSSYYIPHKYWVSEAEEKEKLIETFKARTGKIRCKFFVRNRGHCPFKSDCIYLHELPPGRTPRHRRRRHRRIPEFDPFLLESSDEEEEDEELCALEWALTWALMDAETRESTYRLFMDLSDSD